MFVSLFLQEQYIHPELIATIAAEIKLDLDKIIVKKEPEKQLSAMDTTELESHYSPVIALLSASDMMVITLSSPVSCADILTFSLAS